MPQSEFLTEIASAIERDYQSTRLNIVEQSSGKTVATVDRGAFEQAYATLPYKVEDDDGKFIGMGLGHLVGEKFIRWNEFYKLTTQDGEQWSAPVETAVAVDAAQLDADFRNYLNRAN